MKSIKREEETFDKTGLFIGSVFAYTQQCAAVIFVAIGFDKVRQNRVKFDKIRKKERKKFQNHKKKHEKYCKNR